MTVRNLIRAADGTVFKRNATKAYSFAVIYHRPEGGYYTPSFHTRMDLAQKTAADAHNCKTEIVQVEIVPPGVRLAKGV